MTRLLELAFVAACYLLPGAFNAVVVRYATAGWWARRSVRLAALALPLLGLAAGVGWLFSFQLHPAWTRWLGTLGFGVLLVQLVLCGSLALAGGLNTVSRFVARRRRRAKPVDPVRRRLWQGGLVAIPVLATGGCLAGLTGAATPVRIPRLKLDFPDLPPDLSGFRILHISDLHLSGFVTLDTLADILERARPLAPDLVVVTGDTADDLRLLPAALRMLADLGAPHGVYAVLGNHEYGNGVARVRRIFRDSPVPLLVDESVHLDVGRSRLFLAGLDDPIISSARIDRTAFFAPRLAELAAQAAPGAFRLLLSHRPEALDYAADHGVELVLAGHTHGGQIGFDGQSLLDYPAGYPYPWGHYRRGPSRLYTSSGAGHWLPIRFGCPTEAPVVELGATPPIATPTPVD
ncbi:MAG: metallophosphoesterase [bacterium]|nr:metallophosphoesterase [bacterium]